jgi:Tfp pilus assembly protein PilP
LLDRLLDRLLKVHMLEVHMLEAYKREDL